MTERPVSIAIDLLSDACFPVHLAGSDDRGHDSGQARSPSRVYTAIDRDGLPYVPARTLLGLLRSSWAELVPHHSDLREAGVKVLGLAAGNGETSTLLRIGDARLAPSVSVWVRHALNRREGPLHPADLRRALTVRRIQRKIDPATGSSAEDGMRECSAVAAGIELQAPLYWLSDPTPEALKVLALCCLASRQAGHLRTRGLGQVRLLLARSEAEGVEDRKHFTVGAALAQVGVA